MTEILRWNDVGKKPVVILEMDADSAFWVAERLTAASPEDEAGRILFNAAVKAEVSES